MADKKISDMPLLAQGSLISASDYLPIVQPGESNPSLRNKRILANSVVLGSLSQAAGIVSVKNFGAVGNGTTDDTAAIQAAADYAFTAGAYLYGPPGTYKVSGTITLKCNGNLEAMQLNAAGGSMTGPVVRVGVISGATATEAIDLKLPKVFNTSQTGSNWTGAGSYPGVEIANLYHSIIQLNYTYGFVVGVDIGGYAYGNALNTYTCLGYLNDNKVNLRLQAKGVDGWVNDNVFLGLNARIDSNFAGISGTRNIQLLAYDVTVSSNSWPNNNQFLKPCIEGDAPEFHIECSGSDNLFISPRIETSGGTTPKVRFTSHSSVGKTIRNAVVNGFSPTTVVYSSTGTVYANGPWGPLKGVYDTGDSVPMLMMCNQASSNNPHIMGWPAGKAMLTAAGADTDYTYAITGLSSNYKATGVAYPYITISHSGGTLGFGDGTAAATKTITGTSSGLRVSAAWYPNADNTLALGASSLRWSVVYSATGTINTSDEREKQDVLPLDDAEKRVAVALKGLIRKFRFKNAVAQKGDAARVHVGVIAQDVIRAFEAEGLDATRYGIVCYDEWPADGDQPAGNRYGVRYEELLAFIIAAQ